MTGRIGDKRFGTLAAAGPIQASYDLLVYDWIDDSGEPGDKYDPELAALFREASAGVQLDAELMQEFLNKLEAMDPVFAHLLVDDPEGIDAILLQFPAYSGGPRLTRVIQQDLEAFWYGDDQALTATSESITQLRLRTPLQIGRLRLSPPPSRRP